MTNNEIVSGFDDEKDENLKMKLRSVNGLEGCLVLFLYGYIDTYNAAYFQKRVSKVIGNGFIRLVFQCGGLNSVSSAGIGSFAAFLKSVKTRGGDLVLLEIQPRVQKVFQLMGFFQFFTVKDNLEDSLNLFRGRASGGSASRFPGVFTCPNCSGKLKAPQPGCFRCSECKAVMAVDNAGQVFLG